jgi:hypothetical protein
MESCQDVRFRGMSGAFCFQSCKTSVSLYSDEEELGCKPITDNRLNSSMLRPIKPRARRLGVILIVGWPCFSSSQSALV